MLCGLMSAMCVVVLLEREIDRGYTSYGVRDVELLVEAFDPRTVHSVASRCTD